MAITSGCCPKGVSEVDFSKIRSHPEDFDGSELSVVGYLENWKYPGFILAEDIQAILHPQENPFRIVVTDRRGMFTMSTFPIKVRLSGKVRYEQEQGAVLMEEILKIEFLQDDFDANDWNEMLSR